MVPVRHLGSFDEQRAGVRCYRGRDLLAGETRGAPRSGDADGAAADGGFRGPVPQGPTFRRILSTFQPCVPGAGRLAMARPMGRSPAGVAPAVAPCPGRLSWAAAELDDLAGEADSGRPC